MITHQDRLDVAAWRGLDADVLARMDVLDEDALSRDPDDRHKRREGIRSRAACLRLRQEHGLGLLDKLRADSATA